MADEAFDICENIWNHEWTMQRLLSILRQSQSYCTDNECVNLSHLPGPPAVTSSSDSFMTCLMIAFAVLMYVLRPNCLRQLRNDTTKHRDNEHDSNDEPPAPSTAQ
ncbi:small integral membrane protein 14 [Ceratina calcarata]|uniref:Small integral membrane protein 14 n=1 Tax=Ceratina calcarata TaxID=156304 RepID=A0AAJ7NAT4_9HYME|nr:small integral membrane protein 14 [Ceratina calcarata]XP_017886107.1 small integral membrane protein 14 [Ceratina calcarata]XP_026672373.1 small integral membrane protein 14 [Ceratina calcarata]